MGTIQFCLIFYNPQLKPPFYLFENIISYINLSEKYYKIQNLKHQAKKSKVFAYMSGFGFKNNIKAEEHGTYGGIYYD